jgi:hypothetical protein
MVATWDEEIHVRFWSEHLKRRHQLRAEDEGGRIIIKLILEKHDIKVWIELHNDRA